MVVLTLKGDIDTSSIVLLGFLALCPLMMIFMHSGHKH